MRAVIFVNGEVREPARLADWLRADDHLIGADGGTRHCLALGRLPAVVVGDLDSLEPAQVDQLVAQGVAIERHPARKDKTDLDLAIERAVRDGAQSILLLGTLGGRLDQSLANWLLLARRDLPVPISLAEGNQLARIVGAGETLHLQGRVGSTVSTIPLSAEVTGITYTGLAYPLQDATLCLSSTRGVSNALAAPQATVTVQSGLLLVIQELTAEEQAVAGLTGTESAVD